MEQQQNPTAGFLAESASIDDDSLMEKTEQRKGFR
jgi:hypothetical protein